MAGLTTGDMIEVMCSYLPYIKSTDFTYAYEMHHDSSEIKAIIAYALVKPGLNDIPGHESVKTIEVHGLWKYEEEDPRWGGGVVDLSSPARVAFIDDLRVVDFFTATDSQQMLDQLKTKLPKSVRASPRINVQASPSILANRQERVVILKRLVDLL